MKWFLIQSIFLAALAFGLGALFHRLTWRKTSGASTSTSTDINRFGGATDGAATGTARAAASSGSTGDLGARTAELNAIKAEHAKLLLERDAKVKELSALSFAHTASTATLAERDTSLASVTKELDEAKVAASASGTERQSLTGQIDTHRGRVAELENSLVAATADNDAALAALRSDFEARLSAAKADHDAQLHKVRAEHDASVAQLRLDHEGSLAKVTTDHQTQLQGFAGSHEKAVADSGAAHAAALSALAADHERQVVSLRADHDRLTQEVHGERDRTLSGLRGDHEKALADLRRRSDTAEAELTKARTEADGHKTELVKVRTELEAKHAEVQSLAADLSSAQLRAVDDLEVIEGIGPAMAKALNADGIRTFVAVRDSTETTLRAAVQKAGLKFAPSIPTWSKQAAYLVSGDDEGFKAYTDYLVAGVDPAGLTTAAGNDGHYGSAAVESVAATENLGSDEAFEGTEVAADDLLRIEGVGPKISELLMGGGVRTFRRLAAMPEDSVRSIVHAGGISFVPSIGSWAAQAALLRDGDEAGFQALVDKLVAGRDEAR